MNEFIVALMSSIALKLLIGMLGILFFLRISGKTQMSQMTPVDVVNSFVIGAIVGGIIYAPNLSVWYLIFGLSIWTLINLLIHFLTKISFFNRLFYGSPVYLVQNGSMDLSAMKNSRINPDQLLTRLHEQKVFSLLDVDDVRLETDGQITAFLKKEELPGYLLVLDNEILEDNLKCVGKSSHWLKNKLKDHGFSDFSQLYCVEWTPQRGLYIVDQKGHTTIVEDRERV